MFGNELRVKREALGMTIEDIAREARIASRYVEALETGAYGAFPAKVYAQGAVRRLARIFGGDPQELLVALEREWAGEAAEGTRSIYYNGQGKKTWSSRSFFLTPRRVWGIAGGAILAALIGFWGARLFVFASPPALAIESPADRSRISRPTVAVKGFTEKESGLTVNGREVTIDERGGFDEEIELQLGVNRLQFVSESRFGKMSEEVRYVLVE